MYLSVCLSICRSTYPSLSLYIYISLSLSLSVCLSIYLSIYLSARSETKKFCETSVIFEHKKVQNGTILRDVFIFWTWQHPKRSNSARFPRFFEVQAIKNEAILQDVLQKWKVECRADRLVPMRFAIFPLHLCKVLRLPRKIDARSYDVLYLSRKIISANLKIWCSKMQPLSGNQRPDLLTSLMNMSFVLRLPREMHLWRSSSHVPHLPAFLEMLPWVSHVGVLVLIGVWFAAAWSGVSFLCGCLECRMSPLHTLRGGKSSLTSGWIICAMIGCECLSCMICAISLMNALGSSTSAWASASGLSSTMAMSISPPSFLIRAARPSCILFRIATALFSQMHLSHSSIALCASDPVCGGAVWTPGVPNALRNALSGSTAVGRLATADAARRRSLSLASYERVTFLVMSVSESAHIRLKVKPALGSMYHLLHAAFCIHWAALRLSSTKSLFMSLRRSSSSCRVASRCTHRCLTAPSMCKGHPTGMSGSSKSPSPFCSIAVPSIGTSTEALRLMRGRLHCHVSATSSPRCASCARAGNSGCSRSGRTSSLIISLRPCIGSSGLQAEPDACVLAAVSSSNQVGRMDLTPIALLESVFLMLSRRRVWYRRDHPCGDKHVDVMDVPCHI